MKSKASYFSLSGALIQENLRRFWALPAVTFLIYFLAGIFPILMEYDDVNRRHMSGYIEMILDNQHPIFVGLYVMVPITAAAIVFKYMQQTASTSSMHAMPFTRAKLFNSSVVSGLLMSIIPVIATGLILLAISKPTYFSWAYNDDGILLDTAVNVFARADILYWIAETIMIIFFVFAIAVFAGIVTGNSVLHILAAIGFNFLVPALSLVVVLFSSMHLYGYTEEFGWILALTPVTKTLELEESLPVGLTLIYIAIAIAVYVLSFALYHKRKLEKAGDSIVFGFMIPIICYLIAFFGMTLLGLYFMMFGESPIYKYTGYVAGSIIAFILGRMIVLKTPRVFNIQSVKSFAGFAVIAALFIASFVFDFTGYESRIPESSKVEYAVTPVITQSLQNSYSRFDKNYYNMENSGDRRINRDYYAAALFDKENIEALRSLHKKVIENRDLLENMENGRTEYLHITYVKPNGKTVSRSYMVPQKFLYESEEVAKLYESKEFKDLYSLDNLKYNKLSSIGIYNKISDSYYSFEGEDAMSLLKAMEKDFDDRTFAEETTVKEKYIIDAEINILMMTTETNHGYTREYDFQNMVMMNVLSSDTNTLAWLKDHGAEQVTTVSAEYVGTVEVQKYGDDGLFLSPRAEASADMSVIEDMYEKHPDLQNGVVRITDPDQITYILENADGRIDRWGNYYSCIIFSKRTAGEYTPAELDKMLELGEIDYDFYDREMSQIGSNYLLELYFTEEEAPDFIKEMF